MPKRDAVKDDYRKAVEFMKKAANKNPDSRTLIKKSPYRYSKKITSGLLLAFATAGLIDGYQAYDGLKKLENPQIVQTMSQKEINDLRGRVNDYLSRAGVEGLGALAAGATSIAYRKEEKDYMRKLERSAAAVASIVGIFGGLSFLSSNITGNVISTLNTTTSNIIGATLLLIGVIGIFFIFIRKK